MLQNTIIPHFQVGDTITLTYKLSLLDFITSGCDGNFTYDLSSQSSMSLGNIALLDIDGNNNSASTLNEIGACSEFPSCKITDIGTSFLNQDTTSVGDCISYPFSVNYEVTWFNLGMYADTNTTLVLEVALYNVVAVGLGNSTYQFPFEITNVNWSSNNSFLPNASFVELEDSLVMGFQSNSSISNGIAELDELIIPFFNVGDSFTLSFTFEMDTPQVFGCGNYYTYELLGSSGYTIGSTQLLDTISANNIDQTTNPNGICDLLQSCNTIDIESLVTSNLVTPIEMCSYPIIINYNVQWINNGPAIAQNINISNVNHVTNTSSSGSGNAIFQFPFTITDFLWESNNPSISLPQTTFMSNSGNIVLPFATSIASLQTTIIPILEVGDTLSLSYVLEISEPNITGCGNSFGFDINNGAFFSIPTSTIIETNPINNSSFVTNGSAGISSIDLAISESVNPAIVNHLDTTEITVLFLNASDVGETDASWYQILPSYFEIIQSSITCATASGTSVCGPVTYDPITKIISQTVPFLLANSSLEIKFKGIAKSVNSRTVSLEAYAETNCMDCIPSTNFTQTTFQINGLCELAYAGDLSTAAMSCNNSNDGTATILTSGFTIGTLHYQWFDSLGNALNQDSSTAVGLNAGTYSVIVTDDAVFGCQIEKFITVPCLGFVPPVSTNDSISTQEEQSVTINVLTNDFDADGTLDSTSVDLNPNIDGIQDSIITADGLWFVDNFGNVTFEPNENFEGTTSISYTVLDNDSLTSNISTIFVTVIGVNDAPFVVNDSTFITIDEQIVISVLHNDSDSLDLNGAIDTNSLAVIIHPVNGTVEIDSITGQITYTPNGTAGIDSFLYIVCDNGNPQLCDSAWVYINVVLEIYVLDAVNDYYETDFNTSTSNNILWNDNPNIQHLDIELISINHTNPDNGTVEIDVETGFMTYTPNLEFFGLDSFQYIACYNVGNLIFVSNCDTAWVYILVENEEIKDCFLSFPEGISPNADGKNDIWSIGNLSCYPENKLHIFSRWGFTVYQAKPYDNTWDGRNNFNKLFDDQNLPVGTYFYIFDTGIYKQKPLTGFIYLTR